MLGVIVVAKSETSALEANALLEDFLGAPLLARSIAGALPRATPAYVVVVVPPEIKDEVAASVVERFGLDEVELILGHDGDRASAIRAGLSAMPNDIEHIAVHDGASILVPAESVEAAVQAATEHGAAAPAIALTGAIVADEEGAVPVDIRPRLRLLQTPQVFRRDVLDGALDGLEGNIDVAEAAAAAGATVILVEGDRDNFRIESTADRSRALEVFARRAVDYAFVYPSDLLPEDPLRAALLPQGETSDAQPGGEQTDPNAQVQEEGATESGEEAQNA